MRRKWSKEKRKGIETRGKNVRLEKEEEERKGGKKRRELKDKTIKEGSKERLVRD